MNYTIFEEAGKMPELNGEMIRKSDSVSLVKTVTQDEVDAYLLHKGLERAVMFGHPLKKSIEIEQKWIDAAEAAIADLMLEDFEEAFRLGGYNVETILRDGKGHERTNNKDRLGSSSDKVSEKDHSRMDEE